jgi:hypothetical protein
MNNNAVHNIEILFLLFQCQSPAFVIGAEWSNLRQQLHAQVDTSPNKLMYPESRDDGDTVYANPRKDGVASLIVNSSQWLACTM